MFTLHNGDCLEVLPTFPPASVEAIITDLPYGTTACEWDSIIPLDEMWKQVKRVLKPNGVFVTTAAQPFTTILISSNFGYFKYLWYWYKNINSNFANAPHQPLRTVEDVCVFYSGNTTYNPQPTKSRIKDRSIKVGARNGAKALPNRDEHNFGFSQNKRDGYIFPENISPYNVLEIDCVPRATGTHHPTQKPVNLYEYLIRTYTNAGETVLDICMGSGTTGVAAVQTGRNFIGIEKEQKYFEIASRRIAQAPQPLFTEPPRQPTQHAPDAGKAAAQNELFG